MYQRVLKQSQVMYDAELQGAYHPDWTDKDLQTILAFLASDKKLRHLEARLIQAKKDCARLDWDVLERQNETYARRKRVYETAKKNLEDYQQHLNELMDIMKPYCKDYQAYCHKTVAQQETMSHQALLISSMTKTIAELRERVCIQEKDIERLMNQLSAGSADSINP